MFKLNKLKDVPKFDELYDSKENQILDHISTGRKGALFCEIPKTNDEITLVRTTTKYAIPTQQLTEEHKKIIEKLPYETNNLMMEYYDEKYTKMRYHCDQMTDLDRDSYIQIFSSYPKDEKKRRVLTVRKKDKTDTMLIKLEHNSVVSFSVEDNAQYLHKITGNARWVGLTFRKSKNKVKYVDGTPYLNGKKLNIITAGDMYKLKGIENELDNIDQIIGLWSIPTGTMNPGDLIPPFPQTDLL